MIRTTLRQDTNTRSHENNIVCIKTKINEVALRWWGMGKHSQQLYLSCSRLGMLLLMWAQYTILSFIQRSTPKVLIDDTSIQ